MKSIGTIEITGLIGIGILIVSAITAYIAIFVSYYYDVLYIQKYHCYKSTCINTDLFKFAGVTVKLGMAICLITVIIQIIQFI